MKRMTGMENCKLILDNAWSKMQPDKDGWRKLIDAFGKVCERSGNDPEVSAFAVKCTELLEMKFKEAKNGTTN